MAQILLEIKYFLRIQELCLNNIFNLLLNNIPKKLQDTLFEINALKVKNEINHSTCYFCQRASDNNLVFFVQISPTEIEAVVQQHPDVLEVGVVDIPHPESTSVARAFVRRKAGAMSTEQDLVRFVAERLPEHKQLHGGVQFVQQLPESKGNKLDRIALKKLALA